MLLPNYQSNISTLYHGNCLEVLPHLADNSIDMVLCDLPFGTTYAAWDKEIPADQLWSQYNRLIRGNGAIILHASQPFTSALVSSNPGMFRCEWIWNKESAANFANANKQPLKQHESILVFGKGQTPYYPIKVPGRINHKQGSAAKACDRDTMLIRERAADDTSGMKFPKSILQFPRHSSACKNHPTEKPVPLLEYLIRTYSKEGNTILDNAMGSGSTGIACINTERCFIGIEMNDKYYAVAENRVRSALAPPDLGPLFSGSAA